MLDGDSGQDHFLDMIDKLHVMNLSIEGAAILSSMADAIRSALEKGLLLEQIILNQRNNSLENSDSDVSLNKKKNKRDKLSVSLKDADINELQPEKANLVQEQNMQCEILSETPLQDFSRQKSDHNVEKEPHTLQRRVEENTSLRARINVVSTSLLVDSSLKLDSSLNQNNITNELTNVTDQRPVNLTAKPLSDNLLIPSQSLYAQQKSQFMGSTSNLNSYEFSPLQSNILPNQSSVHIPVAANGVPEGINSSYFNSSILSNSSVLKAVGATTSPKKPVPDNYEQPVMPSPIFIKSEFKNNPPEQWAPTDMMLNIEGDSSRQTEANTSRNIMEPPQSSGVNISESAGTEENPVQLNSYKVFIDASKAATDDEIHAVFKDLNVVDIRIINKPTHTFGFITFSTEEDLKAALTLNRKCSVGGRSMSIRPCLKERLKRKVPPHQQPPESSYKKQRFSRDPRMGNGSCNDEDLNSTTEFYSKNNDPEYFSNRHLSQSYPNFHNCQNRTHRDTFDRSGPSCRGRNTLNRKCNTNPLSKKEIRKQNRKDKKAKMNKRGKAGKHC